MRRSFTSFGLAFCLAAAVLAFGLAPTGAQQNGGTSTPESEWFKSLKVPGTGEPCCDEADCAKAESEWRNGSWWARSNKTGEWFWVPPSVITPETSIFPSAVLCECNPWEARPDGSFEPCIHCFVPKAPGT